MRVASGNVVHNLQRLQWDQPDMAYDWASRFDEAVTAQLADQPADLLRVAGHADYALAVPTPDHFIPLMYLAGLAAAEGSKPELLLQGHSMGSISMACYGLGTQMELRKQAACAARIPEGVPPDQTNT